MAGALALAGAFAIPTLAARPQAKCNRAHPCASPTPSPTATPAPSGLPVIPAGYGTLLRKVFSDGTLAPFQKLTYPDDHIGQPGQFMTVYNRFTPATPTVHDGYLDLTAVPRGDGLWNAMLVGTSQAGNGPTFGYGITRYWLSWNPSPGGWQASWLYDTTGWGATEIDWIEMLENQSLAAHVIGQGAGSRYGLPIPADIASVFHMFSVERRASYVAFGIDGAEVFRITAAMPSTPLAILLDSKVGFPWGYPPPGDARPWLHVAAVTVDP